MLALAIGAEPDISPGGHAAPRQGSSSGWTETLVARDDSSRDRPSGSGRNAPRARPEGDAPEISTEGGENFPRLNPRLNPCFSLGSFRRSAQSVDLSDCYGAPGKIRTSDPQIRSLLPEYAATRNTTKLRRRGDDGSSTKRLRLPTAPRTDRVVRSKRTLACISAIRFNPHVMARCSPRASRYVQWVVPESKKRTRVR